MNTPRILVSGLVLNLVMSALGVAAVGAEPSTSPQATPEATLNLWLKGPFGTVLGADPATPAGTLPADAPLDAWMREAPLMLGTDIPLGDLVVTSVTSEPLDEEGLTEHLSAGATEFAGPDTPGLHVIVATAEAAGYGVSEHAWLVQVPDRAGSVETLFDIPGPRAKLSSTAGGVEGEPGHGCYLYMCMDVGYRPPVKTLKALPMTVGETPLLSLDDGSAMVAWKGTLEPLGDTRSERISARADMGDAAQAALALSGLEPTVAGEWLLELLVEFDRDRGWQWYLYRIATE